MLLVEHLVIHRIEKAVFLKLKLSTVMVIKKMEMEK